MKEDTSERIKMCLNCQKPACNNCLGFGGFGRGNSARRPHPPETISNIMQLYRAGESATAIAHRLGLPVSSTNTIINRELRKG